jgi:plasmid stabilization system protein ParE
MAQISYSRNALANLEHIADFLAAESGQAALQVIELIDDAVSMLARHPLVGRPVESHLRELVISQGRTGYVTLYAYDLLQDTVLVLAIRHQREAGFRYNPAP